MHSERNTTLADPGAVMYLKTLPPLGAGLSGLPPGNRAAHQARLFLDPPLDITNGDSSYPFHPCFAMHNA